VAAKQEDFGDSRWSGDAQTFHGGQEWSELDNFVDDFSVTTNPLGMPKKAHAAAIKAIDTMTHYPPADQEPAMTDLSEFLFPGEAPHRERMMLGNGASELIDLLVRDVEPGFFAPGDDNNTQYKEYERSSNAAGHVTTFPGDERSRLHCIVNPNNPTGSYKPLEDMKHYIENSVHDGSHVLVDESMQPWVGPHWRDDSVLSQPDWITQMANQRGINVFVIHSWTKIWSCTGIRLGSVVTPTTESALRLKQKQVPWSVNTAALEFLSAAVKDTEYLDKTWKTNNEWRAYTVDLLAAQHPDWKVHGEPFLSWMWVDTGSEEVAEKAVELAKAAGTPVRSGKPGYNHPSVIRIAVREPAHVDILLNSWAPLQ